jgi:hypothetical protein
MRFMMTCATLRSALRAPLAVALLAGSSTLLVTGCKDATLESRGESQATIRKVADEFEKAMANHLAQESEGSLATLSSLHAQLEGLRETSAEQQAAAGLLSASIAQTAANLEFGRALEMSRALQHERLRTAAAADAAATLSSIAAAHKDIPLTAERTYLKEQKRAGETSLRAAQESLSQLEGPMNELRARVTERKSELAALQGVVEDLRRRAIEAGAMSGFPLVEQAAVEREKIRDVRASVAIDELELSRLEPDHARTNLAHEGAKGVVAAADGAMDELESFAQTLASESAATSKSAEEYRSLVEGRLTEIATAREELKASYASTEQFLTKAINGSARSSSARNEVARHGKAAKRSAQASLAALFADQAANATSDIQLHLALAGAGELFGGSAKQQAAIDALNQEREEALNRAKEVLVEAIGEIGEPQDSDDGATRGLRNSLNAMLVSVDSQLANPIGTAVETKPAPSAAGRGAAASSQGSGGDAEVFRSGGGFESLEQFESLLGSGDSRAASSAMTKAFRASTPAGRAIVDGMSGMMTAMDPVIEAAEEKWGAEAAKAMAAANPMLGGGLKPGAKGTTKAEYTIPGAMGQEQKLVLVKDGDAWFIDADQMLPGGDMPPEMAGMVTEMIKVMAETMRASATKVADRIRSGAISTPEQLQQELMEAMMSGMGGAAGGFGGPRGGTSDQ